MTQEEFNTQVAALTTATDNLTAAITAETAQIQEFINDHQDIDTSALEGVTARLNAASDSISGIFTPPTTDEG